MSTKLEKSNPNEDNNQNDWDLDDDNWDDWGDAEDNMTATETLPPPTKETEKDPNKSKPIENNNADQFLKKTQNVENNNISPDIPQESAKDVTQETAKSSGGGWGSLFGGVMSSVLSTATELSTTVTHGLDKVIGVPDPEEMARINASQEARVKSQQQHETKPNEEQEGDGEDRSLTPTKSAPVFGLNLVNNVTSLGSKVLNTGLDTLEGIGKKTMTILHDNDPLLKNKIKKFGLEKDKPNLTEILKEAKKETEQMEQSMKALNIEKLKAQLRFEILFENNCGLVHLEALEILSKESQLKIQTLKDSVSGKALEELLETLNEVKELMDLEDLEGEPESEDYEGNELHEKLKQAIEDIELQLNFEEITNLWSASLKWFEAEEANDVEETYPLFAKGVTVLAETCALEILKLHKIAELLMIKDHHSTANEVDGIVQLCKQFNMHLQVVANRFAGHLSKHQQQDETKSHISTLFAEMLQGRQQIEKAFTLFLPILQIGAV